MIITIGNGGRRDRFQDGRIEKGARNALLLKMCDVIIDFELLF